MLSADRVPVAPPMLRDHEQLPEVAAWIGLALISSILNIRAGGVVRRSTSATV